MAPKTRTPVDDLAFDTLIDLPKRTPWIERASQIHRALPALAPGGFDWTRAFKEDWELYSGIFGAILALDGTREHTWGPRPLPSVKDGEQTIRTLNGHDYTLLQFPEAFDLLSRGMSKRQVAHKTGLHSSTIQRLREGRLEPDIYVLEQIAKAFRKQPGFWLEYRICAIFNALHQRMVEYAPESTISLYRKVTGLR